MKIVLIVVGIISVLSTFFLYCCIRAGAQEDRWMEEMEREDRQDAGGKSG